MKTGVMLFSTFLCFRERKIASLCGTDKRMHKRLKRFFAIFFLKSLKTTLYCRFVFTMYRDQRRRFGKNLLQRRLIVYQHVTCRRPHKNLDTTYVAWIRF